MIKQIFEVNTEPCKPALLDDLAYDLFGFDRFLLFSNRRKDYIVSMKKKFIRLALTKEGVTQEIVADYLGYKDHTTVSHHLHND